MDTQHNTSGIINLGIFIQGNFINTGFRFSTMKEAYNIGVKGIVKYTGEGAIYIEAEGSKDQLNKFTNWCKTIKQENRNSNLQISEKDINNYKEFNII